LKDILGVEKSQKAQSNRIIEKRFSLKFILNFFELNESHFSRCSQISGSVMVSMVSVVVVGVSDSFNVGLEASVLVRRVLDDALGAVSFVQSVLALDDVSVSVLPLALVVAGVGVLDSVLVLVGWVVVVVVVVVVSSVVGSVVVVVA
jgi:hypothetical protein